MLSTGITLWNLKPAFSGAASLAGSELQGLALDFTDDFWITQTGHYGSALVRDTGTPANNYNSHPYGLLTYTSPSAKLTLGPTGTLRFNAHNLYLNSAAPANQAITVASGATYSVTITGSVSVAASGAATGTWTSGTVTFTAATGTLTLGSTSGAGTVHVRRTPSDSLYLATGGSPRYALPFEWAADGTLRGIRVEKPATNTCLYSDDLTNAVWTKSSCTAAKTATGADGVANSASTLTATGANATCLQSITSASSARVTHCWIKRRTGTGAVQMTQDNGTTWTAVTVTTDWTRVEIPTQTTTNPIVGLRLVTSGDAIDVQFFGHETGAYPTSSIQTLGAGVARAADTIELLTTAFPFSSTQLTLFAQINVDRPSITGTWTQAVAIDNGTAANRYFLEIESSTYKGRAGAVEASAPSIYADLGVITQNVTQKMAMSVSGTTSGKSARNGVAGAEDTVVVTPTGLSRVALGLTGAGNRLDGLIEKVAVFPRQFTQEELNQKTA